MADARRMALLAVTALLAALALSGCAGVLLFVPHTSSGSGLAGSASAKPAVGDCWSTDYSTAQRYADWEEGASIDCSSSHQLYTYAVASVSSSASSWVDSDGNVDESILNDAYAACDDQFTGSLPADAGLRLEEFFFIAPVTQWRQGARWVRCDVGLIAIGSSFADPGFATLPARFSTLTDQLRDDPELFDECVNTTDASGRQGPYDDPDSRYADCTGDYQWKFDSYFTVPGGDSDPFPAQEATDELGQTECGAAADADGLDWISYTPTKTQWSDGDRHGECWLGRAVTPQA